MGRVTRAMGAGRGGRRPGAGAPRGNRYALKHGQRSRDPQVRATLREARRTQTVAEYERTLASIRKGEMIPPATINHTDAPTIKGADTERRPARVASFTLMTTTPTRPSIKRRGGEDEDWREGEELVRRLEEDYDFRRARLFVRRHWRYLMAIRETLDYLDGRPPAVIEAMEAITGYIYADVHAGIFEVAGGLRRCPVRACSWVDLPDQAEQAETGS